MPRGKHGNHRRGRDHPRWNKARITSTQGYVKVRVGTTHPLSDPNGYAYEHLVVWMAAGNPAPGPGEVIHHCNEDKADNRLENLELLTRVEHNKLHNAEKGRSDTGQFFSKHAAGRTLDGRTHGDMPKREVAA